jgi:hypothetical protein
MEVDAEEFYPSKSIMTNGKTWTYTACQLWDVKVTCAEHVLGLNLV